MVMETHVGNRAEGQLALAGGRVGPQGSVAVRTSERSLRAGGEVGKMAEEQDRRPFLSEGVTGERQGTEDWPHELMGTDVPRYRSRE